MKSSMDITITLGIKGPSIKDDGFRAQREQQAIRGPRFVQHRGDLSDRLLKVTPATSEKVFTSMISGLPIQGSKSPDQTTISAIHFFLARDPAGTRIPLKARRLRFP